MIDTITNWILALVNWLDILPTEVLAVAVGLLTGALSTQWLKRTFPLTVLFGVSDATATMLLRIFAFAFSALPTYFIWPNSDLESDNKFWAALLVGFITPTAYKVATFLLYKRFPKLEARLSANPGRPQPASTGDGRK